MAVALASVMQKLDVLDGVRDGSYTDLPLSGMNATGACEMAENVASLFGNSLQIGTNVTLNSVTGVTVPVDCAILAQRLQVLTGIAQKIPAFKFFADRNAGVLPDTTHVLSGEELLGYVIVEGMIRSLLLGIVTTQQSLPEMFSRLPFDKYISSVDEMARAIPAIPEGSLAVENAEQAYNLFASLGQMFDFDPSPFNPGVHTSTP